MKSKTEKKAMSLSKFSNKKIKNPEAIIGGGGGPIERDKIRTSGRR